MKTQCKPLKFPLFIDICGKPVVVVGAGRIAQRRVVALQQFGADILVVAPNAQELAQNPANGAVRIENRAYRAGDLQGALLALACTDDRQVNAAVHRDALALHIPVSVCDDAQSCTFFFPAIACTQEVVCGIVGDGGNHAQVARVAKQFRAQLAQGKGTDDE